MRQDRQTLLWKIHVPFVGHSFLFGTMHVRHASTCIFLPSAKKAIDQCTQYAAEMHLDQAGQTFGSAMLLLPHTQRLSDFFTVPGFIRARKSLLKAFSLDIEHFERLHPFVLMNMISERCMARDVDKAMDQELWDYAQYAGKEMTGVETPEEQYAIFRKIDVVPQIKALKQVVRSPRKFKKQVHKLVDLYLEQNIHALYQYSKKNLGALRKMLIYDRNMTMAERIVDMSSAKTTFFAIGAGHLSGEYGLIHLLKSRGMTITPMSIGPRPDNFSH